MGAFLNISMVQLSSNNSLVATLLIQPTLDSIEFFYSRMNEGGIIVCDDYGQESCPGANKALNDFMLDKPENIIHLTTGQGVVIKQG